MALVASLFVLVPSVAAESYIDTPDEVGRELVYDVNGPAEVSGETFPVTVTVHTEVQDADVSIQTIGGWTIRGCTIDGEPDRVNGDYYAAITVFLLPESANCSFSAEVAASGANWTAKSLVSWSTVTRPPQQFVDISGQIDTFTTGQIMLLEPEPSADPNAEEIVPEEAGVNVVKVIAYVLFGTILLAAGGWFLYNRYAGGSYEDFEDPMATMPVHQPYVAPVAPQTAPAHIPAPEPAPAPAEAPKAPESAPAASESTGKGE